MAGEYSRELSAKVFASQCRLIEVGFRPGGPTGFGLRRVLIDQAGQVKGELKRGEQKSLQIDRVILMPGPDSEVAIDEGFLKMANFSKSKNKFKYVYLLTPKGITEKVALTSRFLKRKLEEYDEPKTEIEALKAELGDDQADGQRTQQA